MFCKWCGDSLNASDRKCTRCGREVPARSDCGGFYDLVRTPGVTGNKGPQTEIQKPQQPPVVQTPHPTQPKKKRKGMGKVILLMVLEFLLLLALILVMGGKINKLEDRVEKLEKILLNVSDKDVTLDGRVNAGGDFEIDRNSLRKFNETYSLQEAEDIINLRFDLSEKTQIKLIFNPKVSIFGEQDGELDVRWYYQVGDENTEVTEKFVRIEDSDKTAGISYDFSGLRENEELTEGKLSCTIRRISEDGGKLTVTVSGIKFPEKAQIPETMEKELETTESETMAQETTAETTEFNEAWLEETVDAEMGTEPETDEERNDSEEANGLF